MLEEGRRRSGGGVVEAVVEAVGEARAESLGRRRLWASRASRASQVWARQAVAWHCGRLLEGDADAAARRVFDGLFGLVAEAVVLQTVAGRSQGAEMGTGARATHPSDRRTWPRSTRRTMQGGSTWMWRNGEGWVCVCVC